MTVNSLSKQRHVIKRNMHIFCVILTQVICKQCWKKFIVYRRNVNFYVYKQWGHSRQEHCSRVAKWLRQAVRKKKQPTFGESGKLYRAYTFQRRPIAGGLRSSNPKKRTQLHIASTKIGYGFIGHRPGDFRGQMSTQWRQGTSNFWTIDDGTD